MSYEGVPSNGALKRFETITDSDEVSVTQDEHCLEVRLLNTRGFITREAAAGVAIKLLDAANNPPNRMKSPADHRDKMGMTQEEAAEKIGIQRTYLSQIECGNASNVSLRVCRRMAALYDCTIEDLGVELPS